MPKFSQMKESKYLKKEDFEQPALLTIKGFTHENMAMQDQPPEMKWVVYFHESPKGMVLNPTNQDLLQLATGGLDSTEACMGKKIVLFNDPSVAMGGKLVGGLRIRAPRNQPAVPVAPVTPAADPDAFPVEPPDDVPF